jgi:hypothetical protein
MPPRNKPRPMSSEWQPATYGESERVRESIPDCVGVFHKKVPGGRLDVILSVHHPTVGWHLAITFEGANKRLPTWEELTDARYTLMPANLHMAIHLPPRDEYVNVDATTLHLFEANPREVRRK